MDDWIAGAALLAVFAAPLAVTVWLARTKRIAQADAVPLLALLYTVLATGYGLGMYEKEEEMTGQFLRACEERARGVFVCNFDDTQWGGAGDASLPSRY